MNIDTPWFDWAVFQPPGMGLLGHSGGTGGYVSFIGFDRKQRRGIVALSNQKAIHCSTVAMAILQRMPLSPASGTQFVREIVGVGTALDMDQKTRRLRITRVIPNSPASKAGLSAGLIVQKIDDTRTEGKELAECVSLLGGLAGTKVQLELIDLARKATNTVELTRQKFVTSS